MLEDVEFVAGVVEGCSVTSGDGADAEPPPHAATTNTKARREESRRRTFIVPLGSVWDYP